MGAFIAANPGWIIAGMAGVLGLTVWSVGSYAETVETTPDSEIGRVISKNAWAFALILVAVVLLIMAGRKR